MKIVDPITSDLPALFASLPQDKPIVMLNLLKFRDRALYPDGSSPCTGREAYAQYAGVALQKVLAVGGKPTFMSNVGASIIAPPGEIWHEMLLVRYPSIGAFATMLMMPDYLAATVHRTAALEDARLLATLEHSGSL